MGVQHRKLRYLKVQVRDMVVTSYLIIYISFDCYAAYWLVSSPCMQVLTSSISTEAPDSLTSFPLPLRFNIHLSLLSNFTRKFHQRGQKRVFYIEPTLNKMRRVNHFLINLKVFIKLLSSQRECSNNKKVMLFNFYLGQAWQTQYQPGFTGAQRNMIWFRNKLVVFEFHTFFPQRTRHHFIKYILLSSRVHAV